MNWKRETDTMKEQTERESKSKKTVLGLKEGKRCIAGTIQEVKGESWSA